MISAQEREHLTLPSGKKASIRLPSKKHILKRSLVILELDTLYFPKPVRSYQSKEIAQQIEEQSTLKPEDREKYFDLISSWTKNHDVAIYSEDKDKLSKNLPEKFKEKLAEYIVQVPVSWEDSGLPSRTRFENQFYERALRGREPREAIFIGNRMEFIWRAARIDMISVYVPWGPYSLPGSATYSISSVEHLKEFVGRKL